MKQMHQIYLTTLTILRRHDPTGSMGMISVLPRLLRTRCVWEKFKHRIGEAIFHCRVFK